MLYWERHKICPRRGLAALLLGVLGSIPILFWASVSSVDDKQCKVGPCSGPYREFLFHQGPEHREGKGHTQFQFRGLDSLPSSSRSGSISCSNIYVPFRCEFQEMISLADFIKCSLLSPSKCETYLKIHFSLKTGTFLQEQLETATGLSTYKWIITWFAPDSQEWSSQSVTLSEVHWPCQITGNDERGLVKWLDANFTIFASSNQIPSWQQWSISLTPYCLWVIMI